MLVALIAHDKPCALEVRKANRDAHLAYIRATGVVAQSGPLLDDAGNMCGSIVILDVPDMDAARDWVLGDPYGKAGLFAGTVLREWKKVI